MSQPLAIGIVGDYDETYTTHLATGAALDHAAAGLGVGLDAHWLRPVDLARDQSPLEWIDALLCAPSTSRRRRS